MVGVIGYVYVGVVGVGGKQVDFYGFGLRRMEGNSGEEGQRVVLGRRVEDVVYLKFIDYYYGRVVRKNVKVGENVKFFKGSVKSYEF